MCLIIYLTGFIIAYVIHKWINYTPSADDTVATVVSRFCIALFSWIFVIGISFLGISGWIITRKIWNKRVSKWL